MRRCGPHGMERSREIDAKAILPKFQRGCFNFPVGVTKPRAACDAGIREHAIMPPVANNNFVEGSCDLTRRADVEQYRLDLAALGTKSFGSLVERGAIDIPHEDMRPVHGDHL